MYDIRQFKPALYFLVLLGLSAYCLAMQAPALWVVSIAAVGLNVWLVRTGRFTPIPSWMSGLLTALAGLYVISEAMSSAGNAIVAFSRFLAFAQIILLFQQRGNRDFAQILILSLLLMVAASISTASLLFGGLLIVYLFAALYCCLLFHLKRESEQAKASLAVPVEKINPATLRQDQRRLSSSMRRLTGLVAVFSVIAAILVFVLIPRGAGAGFLGGMPNPTRPVLTGFSERVSFQQVARITQNPQVVAQVWVARHGQPDAGTHTLLLRGLTLDVYGGSDAAGGQAWQWSRSIDLEEALVFVGSQASSSIGQPGENPIEQRVLLQPTGTAVLFALPGAARIRGIRGAGMQIRYSPRDQSIQLLEIPIRPVEYEISSSGAVQQRIPLNPAAPWLARTAALRPPVQRSYIDPRLAEYARRPEVSGAVQGRLLADQRGTLRIPSPLDGQIARNIEQHLRGNFTYTTDLTDARRIRGQDPMVAFLYDLKRGHCEYFAGAMTLMCQSLGMNARVVVGFKCDEFSRFGGYYLVRQSHAHAWVEVLTPQGWLAFDPTSGRSLDDQMAGGAGLWQRLKHLFYHLEYRWQDSVVTYDEKNQENLIQNVDAGLARTVEESSSRMNQAWSWLRDRTPFLSMTVLSVLIWAALGVLVLAIVAFLVEKWRMRRRAARIGIDWLPPSEQVRLARQLGFYDELLRLLERRQRRRHPHQTPLEFVHSLDDLPNDIYDVALRLTRLYYQVRFGQSHVSPAQHRRLATVVARLDRRF